MLPLLLLIHIALSIAASVPGCDLGKIPITGGIYTVSDGGNVGSTVEYSCPPGMYPHPSFSRDCLYTGHWTDEDVKAQCRAVQCPTPFIFENGDFYPRKGKYFVGDVLYFECWGGFHAFGHGNRTCQANGKWSGEEAKCDDQEGDCPNPGVPIGATKLGSSYKFGDKVTYDCEMGLQMFGSKERECMESGRWSGAEPSCRYWYTFDTPEEVAETFSASLSETIESSNPNKVEGETRRKIGVTKGGLMNIFIILDTSRSVGPKNFQTAKAISEVFIEKISSFDFTPRYAVISYASFVKPISLLSDDDSTDPDAVIDKIKAFKYSAHGDKTGTNTRDGLKEAFSMLSLDYMTDPKRFQETRNVILLMTDGKHNMGGDPAVEIKKIREILDIRKDNNREDFLDVYVFGLGDDISEEAINDLSSKKDPERHVFRMESVDGMKKAFDIMLDETEVLPMCGLSKERLDDYEGLEEVFPWIAKITITRPGSEEKCKGSIVSKSFVLTAAHCFHLDDLLHTINVRVGDKLFTVKNLYRHTDYNPLGKRDKGVEKSYDYDMALVELQGKLEFSSKIRPICLPCTTGASWALKQRGKSVTCSDHEKTLLSSELVKAMFVAEETNKALERKDVIIKRGSKRLACLDDTKKIDKFKDIPEIKDVVTDNFLCTGGVTPQVDPQTCKGDGGGPLIVPYKQRYFQVGISSWGTIDSCRGPKRNPGPVPALSRDFHVDLFRTIAWLKNILQEDLEFLK
ncbi:complement factor B-like [Anomaloglossus baeobatrachus]|uniref:complement factor B-like n=1 Tax=Anomaloglossus baeobatrachus TaxID=238106 RepID=UPI003F4FFD54